MAPAPIPFSRPYVAPDAVRAGVASLTSDWLTTGPQCAAFEDEFATWVGAEHAITVSSCTAAIELALLALHLPRGSKVLLPAITFCGVAGAIEHAGLVPVLADVDPVTVMMTPRTAAAAARAVGGVDAMVALHFAGAPAPVAELAAAAGLPPNRVVEDAAHAVGTRVGRDRVGSNAHAACFSFYATKNLPIGEGGMVTTDDAQLADALRSSRLHGMSKDAWRRYRPGGSWRYDVVDDGLKANMPEIAAAVGRAQLRHVDAWQDRRAEIAAAYNRMLAHVPGLELPTGEVDGAHGWHLYVVRVADRAAITRDALSDRLGEQGIGSSVHFIPLHHLTHYAQSCVVPVSLTGTETVFPQLLSLPLYPTLTDDEVERVATTVSAALSVATRREVLA